MKTSIREYYRPIFLIIFAVSLVFLIITANDLIFRNAQMINDGLSLQQTGNWEYWIFAFALIFTLYFFYVFIKYSRDYNKFVSIINGNSKQNLVKNIADLRKIAKSLGPKYQEELKEALEKWKVK
ncbi:MAG: DUF3198 domain-containing protein [Candidatus Thermoplasmatota archaeon]|nr:DUF3198 domain-containing protein [Candidatus Thermoplasmatota archaeon]